MGLNRIMILKKICISFVIVLISVIIGSLLMIGSYQLPTNLMVNNIRKSVPLYTKEGLYPNWTGRKESAKLDNYTDALMLSKVICPPSESTIKDAMLIPSYRYKNRNFVQSLMDQLKGVNNNFSIFYYPHYWNGYLIILKPLTMFFDIANIRLLNMLLQMLIAFYLVMYVGHFLGKGYGLSLFLSYLLLNPASLFMSFHYSSVFYVTFLISLLLLKNAKLFIENQKALYLFLLSGILTAFFDLATYPITSLGIPLILYLISLNRYHKFNEPIIAIEDVIYPSLFWSVGYAGMYIGKWMTAWKLTGYNVVIDGLYNLNIRISHQYLVQGKEKSINWIEGISDNIQVIMHEPIIIVLSVILLFSFWKLFKMKHFTKIRDNRILRYSISLVMLFPFIWYSVFCNHSFIHKWFTYRSLSVFTFAVGSIVTSFFLEYQLEGILDEK